MPSSKKKLKLKAKKDKKSRRLSTEDILKLIKTMRPKTQQIVKVHVGDKGGKDGTKKQTGQVQTSYNPPFVFPTNGQAITTLGQPPYQPPLMEAPKIAASWSAQPATRVPVDLMVDPFIATELLSTKTNEKVKKPRVPRKKKNIIFVDENGDPIFPETSESESGEIPVKDYRQKKEVNFDESGIPISFSQPKIRSSSSLGSSSAVPSFFNLPSQNDKYQADIIHTDNLGDQIGTISNSVPSSEWTNSPEGEITLTDEPAAASEPIVPSESLDLSKMTEETFSMDAPREDLFIAPELKPPKALIPPIEEEIIIDVPSKKKSSKVKAPETLPPVRPTTYQKELTMSEKIKEINFVIEKEYLTAIPEWIPSKFIIKRGIDKGKLTSNILKDELIPIYAAYKNAMLEKYKSLV
jgi:hypothetical protein